MLIWKPLLRDRAGKPIPDATVPGRFILHTSAGILYRLDTATGGAWEQTAQILPNGGTLPVWTRISASAFASLQMMDRLKQAK